MPSTDVVFAARSEAVAESSGYEKVDLLTGMVHLSEIDSTATSRIIAGGGIILWRHGFTAHTVKARARTRMGSWREPTHLEQRSTLATQHRDLTVLRLSVGGGQ